MMQWIPLTDEHQLATIREKSFQRTQIIFKHSTRCSISVMVLSRLDKSALEPNADCYFLDLLAYRNISNKIALDFEVHHESPQILVIKNGVCTFDESHNAIMMDEILEQV